VDNLSICIPTFNRYPFLKWTLEKTSKDFPNAHVCISNNASTDDTRALIRKLFCASTYYIDQSTNIGAFENMRAALFMAKTKYCTYLGDDDYLLPDQLQRGIDWLEKHPEVLCYVAPCQLWNEVDQKKVFDAFYVSENITFANIQHEVYGRGAFWNFIIGRHVWPEHIIWRREGLEKILLPRVRAYWAFVDITNAFLLGSVHFARHPFYRSIVQHPVGNRSKLGDRQCLVCFDEYRGGLECMAYDLFKGSLAPELKIQIQNMIAKFITIRLEVAARLLRRQNINAEAESYEKRMIMGMLGRHD
jgi:glycosyltransferase involved in cell wall biosynthesis